MSTQPQSPQIVESPISHPNVTPSVFSTLNEKATFVQYSKYANEVNETIRREEISESIMLMGQPLSLQIEEIAAEFDSFSVDQILNSPTERMRSLAQVIRENIATQHYRFIATVWPPVIPAGENNSIILFLIRCLRVSKVPINILAWLSSCVLPSTFTKQSKTNFLGLCRCKKAKKAGYWAVLDSGGNFKLYFFKGNDVQIDFAAKADRVSLGKDKITVEVSAADKVIASFVPEDPDQLSLWDNIMESKPNLVSFLTSFATPAIDEAYSFYYEQIVNADALILRASLGLSIANPELKESKLMIRNYLTCFSYGNRIPTFVCAVLLNDLKNHREDIRSVFLNSSHSKNMVNAIIQDYGKPYITRFIEKLAAMIDETGGFGIGTDNVSVGDVEKLVSSIVKLISRSITLIPPQIQYILSIVSSYCSTFSNNKIAIYHCVSHCFFIDYIIPILYNIKTHVPSVKNPNIFKPISQLLYVIFSLGQIEGEFEKFVPIEIRLEHHIYPLLLEFAISISSICPPSDTLFTTPDPDHLARSIEGICKSISENSAEFHAAFKKLSDSNDQSILGTSFSSALPMYFVHAYDLALEPKPESPKGSSKKFIPIDRSQIDHTNTERKYYKRIVKHVPRV